MTWWVIRSLRVWGIGGVELYLFYWVVSFDLRFSVRMRVLWVCFMGFVGCVVVLFRV